MEYRSYCGSCCGDRKRKPTKDEIDSILLRHMLWTNACFGCGEGRMGECANFENMNLDGVDFNGADLTGATFKGSSIWLANFRSARLVGADFSYCELCETDFTNADLTRADLSWSDMTRSSLVQSNLTSANLSNADLSGVDLTRANLTDVDLTGSNIVCSNLDIATASPIVYDAISKAYELKVALCKTRIFRNGKSSNDPSVRRV